MIFTLVMLTLLVIAIAALILQSFTDEENEAREQAAYDAQRERYLAWLRGKYAGEQPHGYRSRNHIDFTGEEPLSSDRLAELKQEITR